MHRRWIAVVAFVAGSGSLAHAEDSAKQRLAAAIAAAESARARGQEGEVDTHLRQAAELAFALDAAPEQAAAARALVRLSSRSGDHETAEALIARVLAAAPGGSLAEADALGALGALRATRGDYVRADMLLRQALDGRERALGTGHESVGPVLGDLALVLVCQGRMADAEAALRRGLAIDDAADGDDPKAGRRLRRLTAMGLLASFAASGGDNAQAETLLRRAVRVSEAAPRLGGLDVADVLNSLGKLLVDRGALGEGEKFARRALRIYENASGPRRAERVDALITLSAVRLARGEMDDALALLRRAGRVAELENARPALRAATAAHMGALWMVQGRNNEAEPYLERGLELGERAVGADHPALVRLLQTLADCYRLRNRTDDAEALYRRALDVASRAYGPRSAALLPSLSGLAMLDERRGDAVRADARYREALAVAEETADALGRAALLGDMAAFFERRGAIGTAEHLYLRALAGLEGVGGQDPRRTAMLHGLVSVYERQGRRAEAARISRSLAPSP
jgi:tetratricopeptide (TPR) repeat protein